MTGSILFACWPTTAQTQSPASTDANQPGMVVLSVRVTDSLSHAVVDVNQNAFRILEDGVPQKISFVSKEQIPVTYGLLIDCSGSLRSQLSKVVQTGVKVINANKPDDQAFIIRFISSDKIEIVQETTSDKRLLEDGLNDLYVEGGRTAVIDAVYLAAGKLIKRKLEDKNLRRQALILITDGEDRNSFYTREKLFSLLGTADIQVYVIGFTKELRGTAKDRAVELLTRLATDTGGRVFLPQSISELSSIADEIVNDIRTQYVIGYVPSDQNPINSFHKVQVSIADDPKQEKRIAVTRLGYSTQKRTN
ncbi:MAG: VWA domain-containing protein [Acidobacteriota bacterium]